MAGNHHMYFGGAERGRSAVCSYCALTCPDSEVLQRSNFLGEKPLLFFSFHCPPDLHTHMVATVTFPNHASMPPQALHTHMVVTVACLHNVTRRLFMSRSTFWSRKVGLWHINFFQCVLECHSWHLVSCLHSLLVSHFHFF